MKTRLVEGGHLLNATIANPTAPITSYVNGSNCDIAVYYEGGRDGAIDRAWIFGGTKYGIVVNGDGGQSHVDVTNTTLQNIGKGPGTGIGIYYRAFSPKGGAVGTINTNAISGYWRAGVVANGPGAKVTIKHNIIGSYQPTAEGLTGVQIGFGADAIVADNEIFENSSYWANTPDDYPGIGILIVGGPAFGLCPYGDLCEYTRGVHVEGNQILKNDVGIFVFNSSQNFGAPHDLTQNKIVHNYIWNDECNNELYQAAISDLGNKDVIASNTNKIEGMGYTNCRTYYNPNSIATDKDPTFVPAHAIK